MKHLIILVSAGVLCLLACNKSNPSSNAAANGCSYEGYTVRSYSNYGVDREDLYNPNNRLHVYYTYQYDSSGRFTGSTLHDSTGNILIYCSVLYNAAGKDTEDIYTDSNGAVISYDKNVYDSTGTESSSTDYLGDGAKQNTYKYSYDSTNQLLVEVYDYNNNFLDSYRYVYTRNTDSLVILEEEYDSHGKKLSYETFAYNYTTYQQTISSYSCASSLSKVRANDRTFRSFKERCESIRHNKPHLNANRWR